jgi:Flp pilus assembly protein TadD
LTAAREALRLNPNDDDSHLGLGIALDNKGDLDGAVKEYREALRRNPKSDSAHDFLGFALEAKGDRRGALEEFRAASMLDPKNALYKQSYERLLRQVNQ